MPPGDIIPELPYTDVRKAADWLCNTFGFVKRLQIGEHRVKLIYKNSSIVVTKLNRDPAPCSVMVRVENLDQHFEWAKQAGAQITSEPTDYPYGERQYTVQDIGGHIWIFSQTISDVDPATWGGKLA